MSGEESPDEGADNQIGPVVAGPPILVGYDPLAPAESVDPYPSFARARRQAPVFYDARIGLWSIVRYQDVMDALVNPETFSSASANSTEDPPVEVHSRMRHYPWHRGVLLLDEPEHGPVRAVIREPFARRRAESHALAVRERALDLLAPLERDGEIEFLHGVAFPLALGVVGEILGIPDNRFELLDKGVEAAHRLQDHAVADHKDQCRLANTLADLVTYIAELIEDRRANPTDDYASVMANAVNEDGKLEPVEQLVKNVWAIIAAGFETTANMMTLGIWTLLEHRDQWDMLLADRTLVPDSVEEMLRYRTLVKRIFRLTTRDVEVAGVTIPKGSRVALVSASAHRDASGYEGDPDTFDVSRSSGIHLAFGRGIHLCVGAHLARLEIRIVLELLLEKFPNLAVVSVEPGPAQLRFDTLGSLRLRSTPLGSTSA